ncbi:hypothetical protein MW695_21095, partial [Alkalihalobacillus sp. APA_J-10(15)]|nr:hypothetical protein [Halalkalibacter sp. APA_J-10(15)]
EHWLNSIGVAGIVAGGSLAGTTLRSTTNQLNTGPRVNSGGQGDSNINSGQVNKTSTEIELKGYDYLDSQLMTKNQVKLHRYESAESVNDFWFKQRYEQPPYTLKTVVQDIELLSDTTFVRVYDGTNSRLHGGWLMKAEDIKGLTPAQIQDKFALPYLPEYVGEVTIPKGSNIRLGEVNPLFGHNGGGIQFDLKGQFIGEFKELGQISDWSGLK